jgi:hypothetical protein
LSIAFWWYFANKKKANMNQVGGLEEPWNNLINMVKSYLLTASCLWLARLWVLFVVSHLLALQFYGWGWKKVCKFSGSQQSSSGIHWIGPQPKCQVEGHMLNIGGDALRVTNFHDTHDNTLIV